MEIFSRINHFIKKTFYNLRIKFSVQKCIFIPDNMFICYM
jgi:hypothetical protein